MSVKNLTQTTLKCCAERLAYLLEYATKIGKPLEKLSPRDIQSYLMSIMDKVSAATVNGRIRVFKVFYRHLMNEGLVSQNPMQNIKLVRAERKIKPVLAPDEIGKVLGSFNRKFFHGARNYCMILLTYDSMV